ncbi:MAG: hypothetical protein RL185_1216 [Bacteroidota bacterium]|jgi:hypothetical protein
MRYSTPVILLKYFQYYWKGANSKGHGVHSPFVFKFIQDQLNASYSAGVIEDNAIAKSILLKEINGLGSKSLPKKIIRLLLRLIDQLKPVNTCVLSSEAMPMDFTKVESIDFAYLGPANSTAAILEKAEQVLPKMQSGACLIMEGIHSSSEMEAAWEELKKHPTPRLSIDLFFIGILFCRKEQKEQEHFIIRY